MNRLFAAATLLVVAAVSGVALAHTNNTNGACWDNVPAEPVLLDLAGHYVTDAPGVWAESNGAAGLQTHDHTCTQKHDAEGNALPKAQWQVVTIPADTPVA